MSSVRVAATSEVPCFSCVKHLLRHWKHKPRQNSCDCEVCLHLAKITKTLQQVRKVSAIAEEDEGENGVGSSY